jgi:8-oxo-dGTP pyrophosphatase MutT (NUDIX family)
MRFDRIDKDTIRRALAHSTAGPSSDYDLNPEIQAALRKDRSLAEAAVLCPIVERPSGLHVILTRRSDELRSHSGQVAFPGGRRDPEDPTLAHAALREAEEEIGLPPGMVEMVGPFGGHETVTGFAVTPFVGFVDPAFVPKPDPVEVAEVFEAPLSFLMDPANREKHHREWNGTRRYFYAMPWHGYYIWGATARMLVGLSDRLQNLAAAEKAAE